jgi:malate/lactate dehydrogenase
LLASDVVLTKVALVVVLEWEHSSLMVHFTSNASIDAFKYETFALVYYDEIVRKTASINREIIELLHNSVTFIVGVYMVNAAVFLIVCLSVTVVVEDRS